MTESEDVDGPLRDADREDRWPTGWEEPAVKKFKIALETSEQGFIASVPGLPDCRARGMTKEEALVKIADAIQDYQEPEIEPTEAEGAELGEVEVPVLSS